MWPVFFTGPLCVSGNHDTLNYWTTNPITAKYPIFSGYDEARLKETIFSRKTISVQAFETAEIVGFAQMKATVQFLRLLFLNGSC